MESSSPTLVSLEEKLQNLKDLQTRFQSVRYVPAFLLKPSSTSAALGSQLRQKLQDIREVGGHLKSDQVQAALKTAEDSEKVDKSDLTVNGRRENRKRRRPPSPESPQPYHPFLPKSTSSFFPASASEVAPLRIDDLPDYIRESNRKENSECQIHVWSSTRTQPKLSSPVIVRFTIRDVLTAFITVTYHADDDRSLVVETVTAFGPREKKPPHSQSDYTVYQKLSQQIAKILQLCPRVSFQNLAGLLSSYEGLFINRCTVCQRVLSVEGHVPPVARLWIYASSGDDNEKEGGSWEPRHETCLQS